MHGPLKTSIATAPFVAPLLRWRPVVRRAGASGLALRRPWWLSLILLGLLINGVICLIDGLFFQRWRAASLQLVASLLGYLFIGQVGSIHLDRESKSMSTRWFLNLKKTAQRSLADLQTVAVISYGRLFRVHQVNLAFGSSAPPVVVLVTIKSRRKAKELAQTIAEFLGVPTSDQYYEYSPETTDPPSTPRPLRMSTIVLEVSVFVGLLCGVVGVLVGDAWLAEHGMGVLKGIAWQVLGVVCFGLGMGAVWFFWLGLLLYWFLIKRCWAAS